MKSNESRTLKVLSSIFNFRAWIDYDRTKAAFRYVIDGLKKLFVPQVKQARDFDEVINEMGLTENDLERKATSLKRLSYLMLSIAAALLIYTVYLLFYGQIMAIILSLVVTCIALVLAFRYHFWRFQIQQRKLGCTIDEWYRSGIKGEKE